MPCTPAFRPAPLAVALLLAVAGTGTAHAAAFQLRENSATAQGRAFAGAASAPGDAAVIANNPAAMTHLDAALVEGDLAAVRFAAEFDGSGRYAGPQGPGTGAPIAGGDGGDAGKVAAVPALYGHLPLGERAHFGVSLTAPFGFATDYDDDWIGRYQADQTELTAIDLGAAFSYDVTDRVSLGASVFVQRLDIELRQAIDFGAIVASGGVPGFAPGSADGTSRITGDNVDVGFTAGALVALGDATWLGMSYRSEVEHDIDDGDARFDVPANAAAVLAVARPGWFVDTDGRATVTLPRHLTASVTHAVNDRWSLMAEVTRTNWSGAFDDVTIAFDSAQPDNVLVFDYRDTTFAAVGTEFRAGDAWTWRAGIAYDQSPTTGETRDARVPDTDRRWLSLGFTYASSPRTAWTVGYTHLFTNEPGIAIASSTGSTLVGEYDVGGDVLAAGVRWTF